ncbi:MAG: NUDIX hydrolase, partial [Nitrososphaerales archaeon]
MLQSRTAEYGGRDLHAEGAWPKAAMRRYGGVIFNSDGQVLLREPKDHFDGYVWTFPKGAPDMDEHPVETA